MATSKGSRVKGRKLFTSSDQDRNNRFTRTLVKYTIGDTVLLKIDAGVHQGLFHKRHHGKIGLITKIQGRCYFVGIGNKQILTSASHLYRIINTKFNI